MMPKSLRASAHGGRAYTDSGMPVSLAASTGGTGGALYNTRLSSIPTTSYYPMPTTTSMAPHSMQSMPQASYDPYAVQGPAIVTAPVPHRASSGAWSSQDDQTLLTARAQGLNWTQIQVSYFPAKTSNACRKRHERLMERKGADDFDARRLEMVAKEYMSMRKEIWQGLAQRTGEKWNVVEAKCMSNGLKNLQSAARAAGRRERLESGHPLPPQGSSYPVSGVVHADDDSSGISGIGLTPVDELDPSSGHSAVGYHHSHHQQRDDPYRTAAAVGDPYTRDNSSASYHSSPGGGSHHSGNSGNSTTSATAGYSTAPPVLGAAGSMASAASMALASGMQAYSGYHGYNSSVSSTGTNGGYMPQQQQQQQQQQQPQGPTSPYLDHSHGQRLPSVDMGIDAIINRPIGSASGL